MIKPVKLAWIEVTTAFAVAHKGVIFPAVPKAKDDLHEVLFSNLRYDFIGSVQWCVRSDLVRSVFSVNDIPWQNLRGLPGPRGFEYKALSDNDYSSAFNAELVRLEPGDHSVPHIEPWSHLFYFLSGTGDVTIEGETQPVATGTVCQVRAGQKHSLRNLGVDDMIVLTIYDPPRKRVD